MLSESDAVERNGSVDQDVQVEVAGVSQDEISDEQPRERMSEILEPAIHPLVERLERTEQALAVLSAQVGRLAERVELVPRQVRQLGSKVDDVTESIAQPRVRDLLNSFLLLYDLVEQMSRMPGLGTAVTRNYRVLGDQIAQVLRVNGIAPIADARRFDPAVHKAVETVPCETSDEDGEIVHVYRTGFRTGQAILRYAEVVVKRYQPSDGDAQIEGGL
jgi:molecular chaperone GrpE (heat shock protein)